MEEIVSRLSQCGTDGKLINNAIKYVRSKGDILKAAAVKVIKRDEKTSTVLLDAAEHLLSYNTPFASIVLIAIQCEFSVSEARERLLIILRNSLGNINFSELAIINDFAVSAINALLCVINGSESMLLIEPLFRIVKLLATNLSDYHYFFVKVCYNAGMYTVATDFIQSVPYFEVSKSVSLLPVNYLRYFYSLGLCYEKISKWEDAFESFNTVISAPVDGPTNTGLQCYKKLRLISLVLFGCEYELYSDTPVGVRSYLSKESSLSPYTEISNAYLSHNMNTLKNLVLSEAVRVAMIRDENIDLIHHVLLSAVRRKLLSLSDVYLSLPISEVKKAVCDEHLDLEMFIFHYNIRGRVNTASESLDFDEGELVVESKAKLSELVPKMQQLNAYSVKLKEMKAAVLTSDSYIRNVNSDFERSLLRFAGEEDLLFDRDIMREHMMMSGMGF